MKTTTALAFTLLVATCAPAQDQVALAPGEPDAEQARGVISLKERGANHKLFERTIEEVGPRGEVRRRVEPAYTELASGMHYWEDGRWNETQEIIEPFVGGAVARKGQHKVIFAFNLATAGAIHLETPDGKQLRSHVLGLSYYDIASGKSVMIAEVKASEGQIVNGNQVIYQDAFTSFRADVRYTYTKGGFEQDVILLERPPLPEKYGLDSKSTKLQVLTEFINPPQPVQSDAMLFDLDGHPQLDNTLDFGAMQMARGRAFMLGAEANAEPAAVVGKHWGKLDGRDFLIEEVRMPAVAEELNNLPEPKTGTSEEGALRRSGEQTAQAGQVVPPRRLAQMQGKPMQTAMLSLPTTGLVLDYVTVSSVTNFTFIADTTYYVSGVAYLSGTSIVEGNTAIKFANNSSAKLSFNGPLLFQSGPYRPAVFTVKDDDSVGQSISGSSGSPSTYGTVTFLETSGSDNLYQNVRFSFAGVAVAGSTFSNGFWHAQFFRCYTNISVNGSSKKVTLHNVLSARCDTVVRGSCTVSGEHVTADQCQYFSAPNVTSLVLTNSLLTDVPNMGNYTFYNTTRIKGNSGVYQPGAWGNYYLAAASTNRDIGTTNISASLLADLARLTTYPPLVYSNLTLTAAMSLGPQAQRDTSQPDLGYHYWPLDHVFAGVNADSNVTFAAGTAVGWFRTSSGWCHAGHGIHMGDTKVVTFNGTLNQPAYWVRCNTVQEQDISGGYGPGGITGWADQDLEDVTLSPVINFNFTRCSMVGNELGGHLRDDYGYLTLRATSTEFYAGGIGGYLTGTYLTNCLMYRTRGGINNGFPGNEYIIRNSTWRGGSINLDPTDNPIPVSVKNTIFDGTDITSGGIAVHDHGYNAYLTTGQQLSPAGNNNVTVTDFNWQASTLGAFYLPTNSPLINAGNQTADQAGLYHYTTTTNQLKETNSLVDIGYHYVAVNGNGNPIDYDVDGLANYLEDTNGNGTYDAGLDLASWLLADTDGDGVNDYLEWLRGRNPARLATISDTDGVTALSRYTPLKK